jgi:hypothetical protein
MNTASVPVLTIEPVASWTVKLPSGSVMGTIEAEHNQWVVCLRAANDDDTWWSRSFPSLTEAESFIVRHAQVLADLYRDAETLFLRECLRALLDTLP